MMGVYGEGAGAGYIPKGEDGNHVLVPDKYAYYFEGDKAIKDNEGLIKKVEGDSE